MPGKPHKALAPAPLDVNVLGVSKKSKSAYRQHKVYPRMNSLVTSSLTGSKADVKHTETDARITEKILADAMREVRRGKIPLQSRAIQHGPEPGAIRIWTRNTPQARLDHVLDKASSAEKNEIFQKIMEGVGNMHSLARVANRDLRGTTPNIFVYPKEKGGRPLEPKFTDFGWGVSLPRGGERLGEYTNTREAMLKDIDDVIDLFEDHIHHVDYENGFKTYEKTLRKGLEKTKWAPFEKLDLSLKLEKSRSRLRDEAIKRGRINKGIKDYPHSYYPR